jgi:hypothetical protein
MYANRYVAKPKQNKGGTGFLARVQIPKGSQDLNALFLSTEAIVQYFYTLDQSKAQRNLYTLLGVAETATLADLRIAWRVRQLEFSLQPATPAERVWIERAFNVLAYHDLRSCYDALRRDEDATPVLLSTPRSTHRHARDCFSTVTQVWQ